ncbi:hypothetical protein [Blastopirellula marina]|uniref:Uncharacterized protein n=1 Tax=Blastopirellula marina TaxID=124 RepID=A0A2S8F4T2_9BACT|nr:hypothetical protein [Blastopirellula marina]PQO27140.1 hypothetical protein C5Y98_28240 [Blastopirellula marina]PTL41287.1 hypothetical protein C5Y97_28255 [Blastopirellula marina]
MRAIRTTLALLAAVVFTTAASAENRVTLEVITEKGISITALQSWSKLLQGKGADTVQVRSGHDGEKVGIEEIGSGRTKTFQVKAILSKNETLHMPDGKRFTKRNLGELSAWFNQIKVGGEEELKRAPGKDGMTAAERETLLTKLATKIDFDTKGEPLDVVLGNIRQAVGLEFRAAPSIIAKAQSVGALDDVKGISGGTAIALLLRPYGMIMVPKREVGGAIHLHVLPISGQEDAWPIGHPPQGNLAQVCPVLFQFIEVEINRKPLEDVLAAILPRLKTPLFRDHYKIAKDDLNLNVEVRFPKDKTFYKKILDHVLYQAMLTLELKVDEAGTPFLWVTSAKRG